MPPQSSLRLPPEKQSSEVRQRLKSLRYETVLHAGFGKWRYPAGYGERFPDFVFDTVPYMDLMLRDMGLRVHRKAGWWAELTEAYGPGYYRNTVGKWARIHNPA